MTDLKQLADPSKFEFHPQPLEDGLGNSYTLNTGIDIGYGSLKVMSKYGMHKVPSLVIPFVRPKYGDITALQDVYMGRDDILYIENMGTEEEQVWAVGQKALDTLDATKAVFDVDEYYNKKWFLNKEFQIMFNIGVFLAQLRADRNLDSWITNYHICIGLPVQWVKYSEELKKCLAGRRSFDVMFGNGNLQHVSFEVGIGDLEVIPQHEGALNSQLLDYQGNIQDKLDFAHKDVLLVDAGNRTVDAHLLLKNNKGKSKTWLDVSMLSVKDEVCEYILEETDNEREVYEYQLDKYILGEDPCTIKCGRNVIDFKSTLQASIRDKIRVLSKRLQMVYNLDDLDSILVTGGTGLCYFDELKDIFDDYDVQLVQDLDGEVPYNATYSNVVGFYKLLVYLEKSKLDPQKKK